MKRTQLVSPRWLSKTTKLAKRYHQNPLSRRTTIHLINQHRYPSTLDIASLSWMTKGTMEQYKRQQTTNVFIYLSMAPSLIQQSTTIHSFIILWATKTWGWSSLRWSWQMLYWMLCSWLAGWRCLGCDRLREWEPHCSFSRCSRCTTVRRASHKSGICCQDWSIRLWDVAEGLTPWSMMEDISYFDVIRWEINQSEEKNE